MILQADERLMGDWLVRLMCGIGFTVYDPPTEKDEVIMKRSNSKFGFRYRCEDVMPDGGKYSPSTILLLRRTKRIRRGLTVSLIPKRECSVVLMDFNRIHYL